jgi:kynurenine formamidase
MARRLIDISVPLQNDVPADPPTIQHNDHQRSLPQMLGFFEGLKAEDVPDGQGWAMETVQLSTHNGTHLDAPDHCHPTMNRGERSWTIDEVPLEWCLQPGVKRDFRHLPDGYVATAGDVEAELKRMAIRSRRWKSSWSIPAPGPNTAGRITSLPAAAWATRRPCICSSVACG